MASHWQNQDKAPCPPVPEGLYAFSGHGFVSIQQAALGFRNQRYERLIYRMGLMLSQNNSHEVGLGKKKL